MLLVAFVVSALFGGLIFGKSSLGSFVTDVPANYNCSTAEVITSLSPIPYDTTNANSSVVSVCTDASNFLWYKWYATFTGYFQASSCGSLQFDTVISIYSACTDYPDPYLACDNNSCEDAFNALVNFPVTEGQEYFIAMGNYAGDSGPGTLLLSQANLNLTLFATGVNVSGGQLPYTVSTNASSPFLVNVNVTCSNGYNSSERVFCNAEERLLTIPALPEASCEVVATDVVFSGLTSNLESFYIAQPLSILAPAADSTLAVGAPFRVFMNTTDASVYTLVNFTITCSGGSQLFELATNVNSSCVIVDAAMFGACSMSAVSYGGLYATYQDIPIWVTTILFLTSPTEGLVWPISEPLELQTRTDSAAAGESIDFVIQCGTGNTFTVAALAGEATFYTFDAIYGGSICYIFARGSVFTTAPTVTFTLQGPTFLLADLNGWQGGATVSVNVTTTSNEEFDLTLQVTCPTRNQAFPIVANVEQELVLDIWLNGLACVISTTNLPPSYAPITPTLLDIAIGSVAKEAIIQALNPASFISQE